MKLFFFLVLNLVLSANCDAEKISVPQRLVIIGDSLTEGYGVAKEKAYPSLLEKIIQSHHKNWVVVNAGISGATSASAVRQLNWLMKNKIDLLIIALGANDGLRGLKIEATEKNLAQAIELSQKNKIKVVLAGMLLPPNYGKDYTKKFENMFQKLQKKYQVRLIPFLLDKVGGEVQLNQNDGIHPNEKGHGIISENVYEAVKDLL